MAAAIPDHGLAELPAYQPRQEWRLAFPAAGRGALLRRHPELFIEQFPSRLVFSLYFDTPSLSDYRQVVEGLPRRRKFRLRCYPGSTDHSVYLESKARRGELQLKFSAAVTGLERDAWLRTGREVDPAALPSWTWAPLARRRPFFATRFRRHYFVSSDGALRLTLDEELEFGRAGAWRPAGRQLVLELKFSPARRSRAAEAVAALGRPGASGKYRQAVEHWGAWPLPWTW